MYLHSIERDDGQWWFKCDDDKCKHNVAKLKFVTFDVDENPEHAREGKINFDVKYKPVCAKCDGSMHLTRYEVSFTIDTSDLEKKN